MKGSDFMKLVCDCGSSFDFGKPSKDNPTGGKTDTFGLKIDKDSDGRNYVLIKCDNCNQCLVLKEPRGDEFEHK